jgi:uncharacterized protein YabE (DUF348 family)
MKTKIIDFIKTNPKWSVAISILLVLVGITLIIFSLQQNVALVIDGQVQTLKSFALTPAGVIKSAGVDLHKDDQVSPPLDTLFFSPNAIRIKRAQSVQILNEGKLTLLSTTNRVPADLLLEAGIPLFPKDQVFWNGAQIATDEPITSDQIGMIQYKPAQEIRLTIDGQPQVIFSAQPTLGMALSEAGIRFKPEDAISTDIETSLDQSLEVTIFTARKLSINAADRTIQGLSSAQTVDEALLDLGIPLQALDYTIPPEGDPVPENGNITLVKICERLAFLKEEFPFTVTYEPDPNTELDQGSVIEQGSLGLIINRSRIRYENGDEVSRQDDEPWQASEARDGIVGYGTKVVVRNETVDGQNIDYWRKISVYATSYSPSHLGVEGLYSEKTASGRTLEKGIVAVLPSWYRAMKFQQVYIPGYGYGVIADTGGGISGTPWIDLGYSDNDYVGWHSWVNMYFLIPVPSYIPYQLP